LRKAIITIATGKHVNLWNKLSRHWWELYAKRHSYDIHVLGEEFAAASPSIFLAKYAAVSGELARGYDLVAWIDTDVVVNHLQAPCLSEWVTPGKVSICTETALPRGGMFERANEKLSAVHDATGVTTLDYPALYRARGFEPAPQLMFNTGVFAFLTEGVVDFVADFPVRHAHQCYGPYPTQLPFTYYLTSQDRHRILDERFNVLWAPWRAWYSALDHGSARRYPIISGYLATLINVLNQSWFLHFAGTQADMSLVRGMWRKGELFRMHDLAWDQARRELDDWAAEREKLRSP
jgi:hypothetical protein